MAFDNNCGKQGLAGHLGNQYHQALAAATCNWDISLSARIGYPRLLRIGSIRGKYLNSRGLTIS
jgi:hypothetical protein